MNVTVATPKQSSLPGLVGRFFARLSNARLPRRKPRYVNIGEFSTHLQRDMGFMDGHETPDFESGPDARDRATRDLMR